MADTDMSLVMYEEGEGKEAGRDGRDEGARKRDAANGHSEAGGGEGGGDAHYDLSEKAPRAWVFVAKCQACVCAYNLRMCC